MAALVKSAAFALVMAAANIVGATERLMIGAAFVQSIPRSIRPSANSRSQVAIPLESTRFTKLCAAA